MIDAAWSASERVMVCVDDQPQAQNLVRRGWRMANRYHTELLAAFVETPRWASASPEQRLALEANLRFAEDLGAPGLEQLRRVRTCRTRHVSVMNRRLHLIEKNRRRAKAGSLSRVAGRP